MSINGDLAKMTGTTNLIFTTRNLYFGIKNKKNGKIEMSALLVQIKSYICNLCSFFQWHSLKKDRKFFKNRKTQFRICYLYLTMSLFSNKPNESLNDKRNWLSIYRSMFNADCFMTQDSMQVCRSYSQNSFYGRKEIKLGIVVTIGWNKKLK